MTFHQQPSDKRRTLRLKSNNNTRRIEKFESQKDLSAHDQNIVAAGHDDKDAPTVCDSKAQKLNNRFVSSQVLFKNKYRRDELLGD